MTTNRSTTNCRLNQPDRDCTANYCRYKGVPAQHRFAPQPYGTATVRHRNRGSTATAPRPSPRALAQFCASAAHPVVWVTQCIPWSVTIRETLGGTVHALSPGVEGHRLENPKIVQRGPIGSRGSGSSSLMSAAIESIVSTVSGVVSRTSVTYSRMASSRSKSRSSVRLLGWSHM